MMTEAEALQALDREDPAVADDARAALQLLTCGGGLGAITLLRLQEFLWCALPGSAPQATGRHQAVAGALARLFDLAGMDRYAEVCGCADTARIITAYAAGRDGGLDAYASAIAASPAAPPDTDLLAWSTVMGPDERAAYDSCATAIELALASRAIKAGVSGWKTKRAALVERWLTRPESASPGTDSWLGKISAERIDDWAHGYPGERSLLARRVMPRLLAPPELPDEPLPTLNWLLAHADKGLRLTARHYIAPSLVTDAARMFGWSPAAGGVGRAAGGTGGTAPGKRFQELEVYPLHTLRGLAQRDMGAVRRSGTTLVLTRTGRLMADDAAVRWHIGTAALIGPDDGPYPDFTVAVREAALLVITLSNGPVGFEELSARLTELHAMEGWSSRSGGNLSSAVRGEVHVLRHRLRALRLLDEDTAIGCVTLTPTGTDAALSALLARALRPRRHEQG